jgi:predicted transposase YbfD/YdcC
MVVTEADLCRMKTSLAGIEDPRRQWGNIQHKLIDILVIALCTIIIGENDYESMEDWALEWEAWLRGFLELPNGIPDRVTFRRLFERLEPSALLRSLNAWLSPQAASGGREVNIDGKTARGSGKAGEHGALHVVSAWAGEHNLVLGQMAVGEKSNEITAIPHVLDMIDICGDVVTIDAMGCQTGIAETIRKKKADYILAVKENQKTLYQDIRDYFDCLEQGPCPDKPADQWTSALEKDHGRMERRSIATVTALDWLEGKKAWKDLAAIIRCRSSRTVGGQTTITDRYYISSMKSSAERFGSVIRGHWSIENRLHWSLDVLFREDASQARKGRAPENLNILRKIALARLRATPVPIKGFSTKRKSFKASINPQFLLSVLFGKKMILPWGLEPIRNYLTHCHSAMPGFKYLTA